MFSILTRTDERKHVNALSFNHLKISSKIMNQLHRNVNDSLHTPFNLNSFHVSPNERKIEIVI